MQGFLKDLLLQVELAGAPVLDLWPHCHRTQATFCPCAKSGPRLPFTFRVIRVNPFPDFVFKITDFPILITDDIFEMVLAVWQDDNTKALIDIITDFFPRRHARRGQTFIEPFWPPSGSHIWISEPTAAPCNPHFNVYATGREVNNDEVWLYLCDRDHLTGLVYATLQLPFIATYPT